jgi:hypothetical protein
MNVNSISYSLLHKGRLCTEASIIYFFVSKKVSLVLPAPSTCSFNAPRNQAGTRVNFGKQKNKWCETGSPTNDVKHPRN